MTLVALSESLKINYLYIPCYDCI